ncbi:MAG: Asp-tRNA(Asn)/Glu-tRNA(Gln) amidotransferase subunit GatC [Patescibacteria group bacterium]
MIGKNQVYCYCNDMIAKKEIKRIADLARINIADKEQEGLQKDISKILDYVDKLKELNVKNIEPTTNAGKAMNAFRSDDPSGEYGAETVAKILGQAPDKKGEFVKVKRVI